MVQHQYWCGEQRILIVDELHHGTVLVSIPDESLTAKENRIKDTADVIIYALWVDEPYRKKGVAGLLIEAAEREAMKAGCRTVCLEWDRREAPQWVLDWYERLGYEEKEFGQYSVILVKEI